MLPLCLRLVLYLLAPYFLVLCFVDLSVPVLLVQGLSVRLILLLEPLFPKPSTQCVLTHHWSSLAQVVWCPLFLRPRPFPYVPGRPVGAFLPLLLQKPPELRAPLVLLLLPPFWDHQRREGFLACPKQYRVRINSRFIDG